MTMSWVERYVNQNQTPSFLVCKVSYAKESYHLFSSKLQTWIKQNCFCFLFIYHRNLQSHSDTQKPEMGSVDDDRSLIEDGLLQV